MVPFHYRKVSQDFIQELSEKVVTGESVVLIGPRYSGKRYVISCLHARMQEKGVAPIIQIKLLRETPAATEREIFEMISQAVAGTGINLYLNEQLSDDLFAPIDQLLSQTQKPVVLLAANIDGMAHHLARRFLEGVRTRVESGKLIVVLSGESDFRDLVHGPKSEFNCANQFVLQGFANDEFNAFVCQYTAALNVEFEEPAEMRHILWERTGGNTYLMRLLLWTVLESHMHSKVSQSAPIKVSDIANSIETMGIPGAYGAHILRHTTQVIAREPECWSDLERLIKDEPVKVVCNAPTSLELAGVAIRKGDQLRFASPLMADFIRQHYDNRRLGDLYARNDQLDKAFEYYAHLESEKTIRPLGVDDRLAVELTVKALITSLHSAATKGAHDLKRLFVRGCRYVLGFHEITFWQFDKMWQSQSLDDSSPSKEVIDEVMKILPSSAVSPGLLPVPEPWNSYAIAAILPALRSDQRCAVVISDFERKTVISRDRERLAKNLLEHFVKVYTHAVSIERDRVRLSIRNQHVEIVNSILEALGIRVRDVGHVLAMAERGLRSLGYNRILFCLVDPKGERIRGVPNDYDPLSEEIANMTDWPLDDDPMADLQPYVVYTKQPKIVEDPSREPLANQKVAQLAQMKAVAIVPILNRTGNAIGTIHVEREDDAVPSQEEVDDLVAFGRQLAIVIEQSERVNLMESSLDKIPEPVIIVDRLEHVRYANKPAAELLGIETGWRYRSEANLLPMEGTDKFRQYLQESLTSERRIVHHVEGIGNEPGYRGAVLSDNIQDWREKTIGALLHIQDLNYLYRVFEAFRLVAVANDTSSAISSMFEAAKLLGHKWGRLYLIDENDPNRLVSKLSFGSEGFKDREAQTKFDTGQVDLPRENKSWLSIDRGIPTVFRYMKESEDSDLFITSQGLEAVNVRNPSHSELFNKKPGDMWVDFPLITQQKALGKLTLQCDENSRAEDFELLKVLSGMVAGLLDAFLRKDLKLDEREQRVRLSSAEKIMATVAHNIATRLGAFPVLLAQYQIYQERIPELKELNDNFLHILEETLNTIRRAKELLSSVHPIFSTFDIASQMERSLRSALPDYAWTLKCEEQSLEVEADSHLLESALFELVQNSRKATVESEQMRISVTIDSMQRGLQNWVRIVYRDNGPGVPDKLKDRIFEDFFSRRPGQKTGTGLGLGFVRRIIEAHCGTIREKGQPGQGVEFVIEIPRFATVVETKEGDHVSRSDC